MNMFANLKRMLVIILVVVLPLMTTSGKAISGDSGEGGGPSAMLANALKLSSSYITAHVTYPDYILMAARPFNLSVLSSMSALLNIDLNGKFKANREDKILLKWVLYYQLDKRSISIKNIKYYYFRSELASKLDGPVVLDVYPFTMDDLVAIELDNGTKYFKEEFKSIIYWNLTE